MMEEKQTLIPLPAWRAPYIARRLNRRLRDKEVRQVWRDAAVREAQHPFPFPDSKRAQELSLWEEIEQHRDTKNSVAHPMGQVALQLSTTELIINEGEA